MTQKLYRWFCQFVHTPYADISLGAWSFLESIIFPPVAPLFIFFCLERKDHSYKYATITTVFSVIGGLFAYAGGYALWSSLTPHRLSWLISPAQLTSFVHLYQQYGLYITFVGSCVPMPYKALSVAAGFCRQGALSFAFASVAGRALRYYVVAYALYTWNDAFKIFIKRWSRVIAFVFIALVVGGMLLVIRPLAAS